MGKRAKPSPFAPLERDVEPPLRKLSFVRARRADPPLVSEEAQRRMIVLDAARDARADANGRPGGETRARHDADADDADDEKRSGESKDDVANPLYPRASVHFSTQWPSVRRVGAGLANLGNTCFLNAVTQCLTHTPPLASFCLAGEHRLTRRGARGGGGFDAVYEMGEHICRALGGGDGSGNNARAIAPVSLVKNLRSVSKTFRKGRQEDAHEFARCVLDAMHKRQCDAANPKVKEGTKRSETSFVWRTFGGTLRSRITCATCGRASDKFDGFMDLSLDIARAKSVSHALKSYVAVEVLDGANKYKCEMGPGKPHMTRATKQFTIDKAPLILTVQLKRFEYVPFGRGKLNQFVEYPTTLDLSAAMSENAQEKSSLSERNRKPKPNAGSKPTNGVGKERSKGTNSNETYSLFGVVVHSGGSMHSGHYYCYVKGPTGYWYEMDDETVTQCGESMALKQRAYLLFYAKNDSGPNKLGGDAGAAARAAAMKAAKNANDAEKEDRERSKRRVPRSAEEAIRGDEDSPEDRPAKPLPEKKQAREGAERLKVSTRPERNGSARRRERSRAGGADADALETVPGSPSGSERSNSLRSPHRGGKLLSSRDSARLRLISKRLRRDRDHASKLSPVKTRAARRAERERERAPERNGGRSGAAPGKTAVLAKREAEEDDDDARNVSVETPRRVNLDAKRRQEDASSSDPKSVKRWLTGSARAFSAVGRGARGEGGGWDDDDERGEGGNSVPKRRQKNAVEDPKDALLSTKRRRAYDELDEEYDRGRVAKHARRREAKQKLAGKPRAFGSSAAAAGSKRNPFQSKARSKASNNK